MSNAQWQDRARSVRSGEELPLDSLQPWLQAQLDLPHTAPEVTQYSGGASNWTYCLRYAECEVILRRAPAGRKAKGAHDMAREYRLQKALAEVFPFVPQMLGVCQDDAVIGSDFYIMQKLNGIIPRANLPKDLDLSRDQIEKLCLNAIDTLIALHKVDYVSAGLNDIAKGSGYVSRQIHGWNERYVQAKTWQVPSANGIREWLVENMPTTETICLTHNDFRFDNLVLDLDDPTRIIGVLDWELATLGDPLMDLGNSLAYWVEAGDDRIAQGTRRQPTHLPGMLTRQEVIEYYAEKTGADVSNMTFYQVYGLFRLAAIVQQIYYRYHHKQTRNKSFRHLWFFNHYLQHRCRQLINRHGISA